LVGLVRRTALVAAVLAALTVIYLRHVLLPSPPGAILQGNDYASMFYPLHEGIALMVRQGELPLWNPHQYIGHPIIGNAHAALFYPGTWFQWIMGDVPRAMNILLVVHTWIAALGFALFVRTFGANTTGSILAGVVYAMGGWAAARLYAGHYNLYFVFAWIPYLLTGYRFALSRQTLWSLLPGMGALGIALLSGYPPLLIYALWGLLTLAAYHILTAQPMRPAAVTAVLYLAAIGIGGLLLGAALVLPVGQLVTVSPRSGANIQFANSYAMPPAQLLTLFAPNLFGNQTATPSYWGAETFEEMVAYSGILPLITVPLILRWRFPRHSNLYFAALVGLGVVMAIGLEGTIMPLIWRWIPGSTSFRVPARGLLFAVMGMAGTLALLITALMSFDRDERRIALRSIHILPILAVTLLVIGILFTGLYATNTQDVTFARRNLVVSSALTLTAVFLFAAWSALWGWTQVTAKTLHYALAFTAVVVLVDVWQLGAPNTRMAEGYYTPVWEGVNEFIPPGTVERVIAPRLHENQATPMQLNYVDGYDPQPIDAYLRLIFGRAEIVQEHQNSPLMTLLGVKYLLADQPYNNPNWQLLGTYSTAENTTPNTDPDAYYYERMNPFPRAWVAVNLVVEPNDVVVHELIYSGADTYGTAYLDREISCMGSGGGTAEITEYRPNDVTIRVNSGGGLLILTDQYYSGWQATVNGQPAEIYRTDTVFRGVCVPPGEVEVKYAFRPTIFYVGVVISAISWIVWGGLITAWYIRHRKLSRSV
jgi:hypothetical protein